MCVCVLSVPVPVLAVPASNPPAQVELVLLRSNYMLNMDVADIRNLMRKTKASILENGFLGKGIDELKDVSVAI